MKKTKPVLFKPKDAIILVFIILVAFGFRLYKYNTPLADFHSWRQVDTAAISRNFERFGFDLMHPKYDDLSNIQSGKENPNGYRFVEFPIYNTIFAGLHLAFPFFPLEVWGRFVSIFFSLTTIAIIYYFLLKEVSRLSAVFGAITYAVMPYMVFFSRVVLPEPTAVGFTFIGLFFLHLFINEDKNKVKTISYYVASLLFFIMALLVKPTAIFFGLAYLFLFVRKYEFNVLKKFDVYLYFILAAIPLLLWRSYITQFPEGIPASEWLITGINTGNGLEPIFLRPAFFRWVFYERINQLILGGYLVSLLVVGLMVKQAKFFLYSILLSSLAYLFVFEGGNVQHAYYQILIFPALALFVGIGAAFVIRKTEYFSPVITYPTVVILFVISFSFSYYNVKNYYGTPGDLMDMAKIVKTFTKPSDKIVTDTLGDTTLLYLSDRRGSPAVFKNLPSLKKDGYSYFITQKKDVVAKIREEEKSFKVVYENNLFALIQL
jgi:hypothetical protein